MSTRRDSFTFELQSAFLCVALLVWVLFVCCCFCCFVVVVVVVWGCCCFVLGAFYWPFLFVLILQCISVVNSQNSSKSSLSSVFTLLKKKRVCVCVCVLLNECGCNMCVADNGVRHKRAPPESGHQLHPLCSLPERSEVEGCGCLFWRPEGQQVS